MQALAASSLALAITCHSSGRPSAAAHFHVMRRLGEMHWVLALSSCAGRSRAQRSAPGDARCTREAGARRRAFKAKPQRARVVREALRCGLGARAALWHHGRATAQAARRGSTPPPIGSFAQARGQGASSGASAVPSSLGLRITCQPSGLPTAALWVSYPLRKGPEFEQLSLRVCRHWTIGVLPLA
jgi:hypothetical protein